MKKIITVICIVLGMQLGSKAFRKCFWALSFLFFFAYSYSQPTIQWEKTLGGSNDDVAKSIIKTSDGGYAVVGNSSSSDGDITGHHGTATNIDCWVTKLNSSGVIEWQKSLGGSLTDGANSIIQTSDGGYAIAGYSYSNDGDVSGHHGTTTSPDSWIIKLSSTGTIVWQKSIGGTGNDQANSIIQTTDGGYIIAGWSDSNNGDVTNNYGSSDYWVVKINTTGTILWQKSLGGSLTDAANSIIQTSDGGYAIVGYSYSNNGDVTLNHGSDDYWVVKTDSLGTIQWQKSFGGTSTDDAYSIIQTNDGGYAIAGYAYSSNGDVTSNHGQSDYWLVKLDSAGNLLWQKTFGGTLIDKAYSIISTSDNGFVIAGETNSNNGDVSGLHALNADYWIIKLDSVGTLKWQKPYGSGGAEAANSIVATPDGGYAVAGYSQNYGSDVSIHYGSSSTTGDYWIVKLSPCMYNATVMNVTTCGSYTLNGQTYTANGNYTQTFTGANGCDSLLILNLVTGNSFRTISVNSCNSYSLNSQTYSSSGSYTQTLTNWHGCDSIITINVASGSWEAIGNNDTSLISRYSGAYTSISLDNLGTPYIIYSDGGFSNKATVKRYSGGIWQTIGAPGFSSGASSYNSIAIDGSGTPYVAYKDAGNLNKATVMKFNGTAWVTLGMAGFSDSTVNYTSIAIDPAGVPYVAFQDLYRSSKITVMKFNGTVWVVVGTAGFSAGAVTTPIIKISNAGMPYVGYQDGGNGGKATVMKFNGVSWVVVGLAGFSPGTATYTSLALNSLGEPYLAFSNGASSNAGTLMKFDGTTWVNVGGASFSATYATDFCLTISNSGIAYVIYRFNGRIWSLKYNGSSWSILTWSIINNNTGNSFTNLTISVDSMERAFFICSDNYNIETATVYKIMRTDSVLNLTVPGIIPTQTGGASSGDDDLNAFVLDASGNPYIAFEDKAESNKITVMKFNGTLWVTVGSPGFSSARALDISMIIDRAGVPYVFYIDSASSTRYATVKKYDGNSWVDVGPAHMPLGYSSKTYLAVDSSNLIYLAFGATVMKFNGSSWVSLPAITNGQIVKLGFDSLQAPMAICLTGAFSYFVTKYNGTVWAQVGSQSVSVSGGNSGLSAQGIFTRSGNAYVAFYPVTGTLSVMKFNGSSWSYVGNQNVSGGSIFFPSIAIDNNNNPYVSYNGYANYSFVKTQVLMFKGNSWINTGTIVSSFYPWTGTNLAINQTTNEAYVAFGQYCNFVKKFTCPPCITTYANIIDTACGSYTLNSQTYTSSGIFLQTLTNHIGCDSIVTLNLVINNTSNSTINDTSCSSYTLNSQTYSSSGTYSQTLTNAAGCDSIITLHLIINNTTSSTLNETACTSYVLNSQTYTASGTYTQTLINSTGCDSIITLNLIINNTTSSTLNETACTSYVLNSQTYTASGTYTQTLTNSTGCDSIVTLNLIINNPTSFTLNETACTSYVLNSQTYSTSGTYSQTLTNSIGCDSIVTLNLIINNPTSFTLNETACTSYVLNSQTYTASGTYVQILTNSTGCDSIVTLNLIINNTTSSTLNETACTSYVLNSQTYTASGTYTQTLTNVNGCDSLVTLNLLINNPDTLTINNTSCNNYTLNSQTYSTSGTYYQTLTNINGCDSTVVLNLTINPASPSQPSTILGVTHVCEGSSSAYAVTNDTNATSYTWTLPTTWTGSSDSSYITATADTTAGVIYVTANNSCGSSPPQSVNVYGSVIPVVSFAPLANVCDNAASFTLYGGNPPGGTYSGQGVNSNIFTPATVGTGTYYITYTYVNGACTIKDSVPITVDICLGINQTTNEDGISIFPNPFTAETTIAFNEEQKNTVIIITDILGKELRTINFTGKKCTIEKAEMQAGIYFLQIMNEKKSEVNRKIIVQ